MPGLRIRLGSFSSHSSRGSNQESLIGNNKLNGVKYEIKLAVLGQTGVGKTAIIHRFLYDQFPEKHHETIDEVYLNELELVKGIDTRLTLDILDCGGSNEFPAMKRISILNCNAFILVYSIDDAESFEEVRRLRELIYDIKLEKHIAKYSSTTNNNDNSDSIKNNSSINTNNVNNIINNNNNNHSTSNSQPQTGSIRSQAFVRKETPTSIINPMKEELKVGQQRRHSLNNQMNGTYTNGRLNGQLNGFHNLLTATGQQHGQMNNQINNNLLFNNQQQQQNNQTKRHHHHHHKNASDNTSGTTDKKSHKKPYIITNINQRYKLSENLKLISERRKSLTNSTKLGEQLKSKLGDISEITNNLNDVTHQSTTADILCLRPSKLQTTSLPVYGSNCSPLFDRTQKNNNTQHLNEKTNADDTVAVIATLTINQNKIDLSIPCVPQLCINRVIYNK